MMYRTRELRGNRSSWWRTVFHVLALVMIIVQSLPLGTALAASATATTAAPAARQAAQTARPASAACVADTSDAVNTRDALDCALDVGDQPAVRTDLLGLVRRHAGITPEFAITSDPAHGVATIVGSTLTYTPTTGFRGDDAVGYRTSDTAGLLAGGSVVLRVGAATTTAPAATTRTAVALTPTPQQTTAPPSGTVAATATPTTTVVSEAPAEPVPQPTTDVGAQPQAVPTPANTGIDLALNSITAPSNAFATKAIVVSWLVRNKGTKDAPKRNDRLYLSTDKTIGNDWDLGVFAADILRANERFTNTMTVKLPNVVNGTYFILAMADAPNRVAETTETNNLQAFPIKVVRLPDLAPTMLTAPGLIAPGVPTDVRWRVGNTGGSPAGVHEDRIFLSTDNKWDGTDRLLVTSAITQPLAINTTYTRISKVTLPVVTSGVHYLIVATDARSAVAEGDETNNVYVVPVSVTRPPVAADTAYTIGVTDTVQLDLRGLAKDPDNDPLQFTLPVSPTYGQVSLTGSTLIYTPTAAFTESDDLAFAAADPWGGKVQARIRFTTTPTRLHIEPGSVMLGARGEARSVTVKAYDPFGREVSTDGMNLQWMSNAPTIVSVTPGGKGINATVRAVADVGSAVIVVRSATNPKVESAIFMATIATLAPGVQSIADARIVFPPANELPNQPNDMPVPGNAAVARAYQTTASGTTIGGFTQQELEKVFVAKNDGGDGFPSFMYPVVLQGTPPAVGSTIVASESAPVVGRVVKIVAQRNGFALVQLETSDLASVYDKFTVTTNFRSLIDSGFVKPEQLVEETDDETGATQRNGMIGPLAEPKPDDCKTEFSGFPVEIKPLSLTIDPDLDIDLQMKTDPRTGDEYLALFKLVTTVKAKLTASINMITQAGLTFSVECSYPKKFKIAPPNIGVLAIINMLVQPNLEIQPKSGLKMKFLAGPRVAIDLGFKVEGFVKAGFIYTNPSNLGGEWDGVWDSSLKAEPIVKFDGIGDDNLLQSFRVEVKSGGYLTGKGQFTLGGGLLDKVDDIFGIDLLDDWKNALTLDFLKLKAGPELEIDYSSDMQVLNAKFNTDSFAGLSFVGEAAIASDALKKGLGKIAKVVIPEIKLPSLAIPLAPLYTPLKGVKVGLQQGDRVTADKVATVEAQVTGKGLKSAKLFVDGKEVGELPQLSGTTFSKPWVVPQSVCDAAEATNDGYATVEVLAFNEMFNETLFGFQLPGIVPIANYIGSFNVTCSETTVASQILVNGKLYTGPMDVCVTKDGSKTITINVQITGRDELKRLENVGILSNYKPAQFSKAGTGKDEKLEGQHTFEIPPTMTTVPIRVYARYARADGSHLEYRDVPLNITVYGCITQTESDSKWAAIDDCFEAKMARSRQVVYKMDIDFTQIKSVEHKEWSDYRQDGPMVPRGNCDGRVVRMRGDPHIVTPDGHEFDSFALGEFVYLEPRPGNTGVAVQVRQERIPTIRVEGAPIFMPWTSYNTAIVFGMDNQRFEFRQGHLDHPLVDGKPVTLTTGLQSFGAVDIKLNSVRQVEIATKGYTFVIDQVWTFIELRAQVPRDDTHYGMLGTPNSRESDDMRLPDGTPVSDPFDLANGWRVRTADRSLFTYAQGTGPETYNLPQLNEPPSREELAPFREQARQMLLNTCQTDTLSDTAINNTAMELYTGRTPAELASTGLCWYDVQGVVTNQFVANLPVPGARISVTSDNGATCETSTDRNGYYICQIAAQGDIPTFTVRVSGRGTAQKQVQMQALPPMEGTISTRVDLVANPTTVAINGTVKDSLDRPLYNAEVQLNGPANAGYNRAFAVAQGDGTFTSYLMLNDGVTAGAVGFRVRYNPSWQREPTAPPWCIPSPARCPRSHPTP